MPQLDNRIVCEIELPGIKKEDISIFVEDTKLKIGWKKDERNSYKLLTIPKNIDNISARLEDSVLYITFHIEEKTIKNIEIKE